MIKIVLLSLAALLVVTVGGLMIYASTKPDSFHVRRSIAIKAPPEKIFPHINELKRWTAWSPYEKKDPAMKRTFSGPPGGKGAAYEWDGDKNVGQGRMEITESSAPSKVVFKLDFFKPFEAHNTATFTLQARGAETEVTWAIDGPSPFISKLMGTIFNLDKMIGNDFAAGLASLKAISEP